MRLNKNQPKKTRPFVPRWRSSVFKNNAMSTSMIPHKPTKEVSVMAWLENEQGEVLMVKQVKNKKSWALPGGKVKVGESLRIALKREVWEETGLFVTKMTPRDMFDRHAKNNVSILFDVKVRPKRNFSVVDPSEISEVAFKKSVPGNATPTLRYFYSHVKSGREWT